MAVANVSSVVARRSKYSWLPLTEGLRRRQKLSLLQILLICGGAEAVEIPAWVAYAAKSHLKKIYYLIIYIPVFNLIHTISEQHASSVYERSESRSYGSEMIEVLSLGLHSELDAWNSRMYRFIRSLSCPGYDLYKRYAAIHFLKTFQGTHHFLAERLVVFGVMVDADCLSDSIGVHAVVEIAHAYVSNRRVWNSHCEGQNQICSRIEVSLVEP